MAVNTYNLLTAGSAITWAASGGTHLLTLTGSITTGNARQGAKGDLGEFWRRRYYVLFSSAVGTAATTGNLIELYWAASPSAVAGTDNPGSCTGVDAAYANPSEYKFQLQFIGALYLSNNAGTGKQTQVFEFCPPARYGMPVVINSSGQTLSTTASNHEVRLVPIDEPNTSTATG